MPRTAMPAVSVIVPLTARAELLDRAGRQLRAQTLSDIEIILVGGEAGADQIASLHADERVRREAPGLALADALNAGLEACRGERVLVFDPRDELVRTALEALAVRMRHGGESGAFGGYRFRAPIGDLPHDPLKGAPEVVGFDELARCQWFPLSAMMVDAAAIGGIRFSSTLSQDELIQPADYEWLLRLSEVGVRWSQSKSHIGAIALRPLRPTRVTSESLAGRARVLHARATARGWNFDRVRAAAQDIVDAHVGLIADSEDPPSYYSAQSASSAEMARWWHRLGYAAVAPDHLRPAFCRSTMSNGTPSLPEQARAVAESLDPLRCVVLAGSGQGIKHLAGIVTGLGMPLRVLAGSEHSLSVDRVEDPRVLQGAHHAPPGAQFVASSHEDAELLLPGRPCTIIGEVSSPTPEIASLLPDGSVPAPPAPRGLFRLPSLIADRLVSEIDADLPTLLVGLGRNARRLARLLQKRGDSIDGFDHSLQRKPDWCDLDGISLNLLTSLPHACARLVIPLIHDAPVLAALARALQPSTRIARWASVADVLCGLRSSVWTTLEEALSEHSPATSSRARSAA